MHGASIIVDALVAVGTLLVAAAAIWGDWLRSRLAPAKLTIETHNLIGHPTVFSSADAESGDSGTRAMFFHLKVLNRRPWTAAKNCRVLLKAMTRRGPDGRFYPVPMSIPTQFVWAPAEITPPLVTIVKENIFDLGFISETEDKFIPRLFWYPHNFQGFVGRDEAVRYHLEIEATNFSSSRYQVFEVAWDGEFDHEPARMEPHLRITEIKGL